MITRRVDFRENSKKALRDPKLKKALVNFTDRSRASRGRAVSELSDWEELRSRAREIKKEAIDSLDEYLLELEESVVRAGGRLYAVPGRSGRASGAFTCARWRFRSSPASGLPARARSAAIVFARGPR